MRFMIISILNMLKSDDCFSSSHFRWTEDTEKEVSLHKISAQRAGERVFLQCLHQQRKEATAFQDAQPHRPSGQNMVSKQKNEREKTEQRPLAVLHLEPFALDRLAGKSFRRGASSRDEMWPSFLRETFIDIHMHLYSRYRLTLKLVLLLLLLLGCCYHYW